MRKIYKSGKWREWCKKARLRVSAGAGYKSRRNRRRAEWCYLDGRGHVWRVNFHGMFQRGDTYAEFDRWALCTISEVPCPASETDFLAAVESLLKDWMPS